MVRRFLSACLLFWPVVSPAAMGDVALRAAAEQGDAKAQYRLALTYLHEEQGLPVDLEKAERWLKKAAEKGLVEAQYELGMLLRYDLADAAAAIDWWQRAAAQGSIDACMELGLAYLEGEGVTQDLAQAERWLKLALEAGHEDADEALAELAERREAIDEAGPALEALKKGAEGGDAQFQYDLGLAYLEAGGGQGDKATYWLTEAAMQGHRQALFTLGEIYNEGRGVDMDPQTARRWLEVAVEAGVVEAELLLAELSDEIQISRPKAIERWQVRARVGKADAQYNLALAYLDGRGVAPSVEQARYWMEQAAAAGHGQAQYRLGDFYLRGVGGFHSASLGLIWMRKAASQEVMAARTALVSLEKAGMEAWLRAEQGDVAAQYTLARSELKDSPKTGLFWLRRAARGGHPPAQRLLGQFYLTGKHVEANRVVAYRWLDMAAGKGDAEARRLREQMFENDPASGTGFATLD